MPEKPIGAPLAGPIPGMPLDRLLRLNELACRRKLHPQAISLRDLAAAAT
jgi:hypothetical protein